MEENQEIVVEEPVEVSQEESQVEETREAPIDKNWRQAQQVMSDQKREIDELKAMMYQMAKGSQPEEEEEDDDFENEDDDEYVTVATAKKIAEKARKTAEKHAYEAARKAVNQHLHNQNIAITQDRAREKYPDYDEVIRNYTVPLINNDPALAHKINTSKNPAETAYRLGKISDDYVEHEMQRTSPRAEKVIKNSQRPGSSHSAQSLKTQVSEVTNLTAAETWARAQEYANMG